MDHIEMLQPPGAMIHYLITRWTPERVANLRDAMKLNEREFGLILLGAVALSDYHAAVLCDYTGIPAQTFSDLENEFSAFSGDQQAEHRISNSAKGRLVETLFSAREIKRRVAAVALEMQNLIDESVVLVPVLKGAFIFSADLIRLMFDFGIDPAVEFIEVSSYRNATERNGMPNVRRSISPEAIEGKTALIIDDICDTGETLRFVSKELLTLGAKDVRTCVLINKNHRRSSDLIDYTPDYVGFNVGEDWVVGYGMDTQEHYRGSPEVGALPKAAE